MKPKYVMRYALDPFNFMLYENTQLMEENAKLREFIYDLIIDEERGHNDDMDFREHVNRAHEYGIAQDIEVGK